MSWQLHWLEAAGSLGEWRHAIAAAVDVAYDAVAGILVPSPLDIVVLRSPYDVVPEYGIGGFAHRPTVFSLTIDPANPDLEQSLRNGALARTVVHEAHHCFRMAGPGYGRSLGEALVSEGLAGRFVHRIFDNPPEPWENAVADDVLNAFLPDAAALAGQGYDHDDWFYGAGDRFPRWLGYTLGYRMAGDWLDAVPGVEGSRWVNVPAAEVIAASHGRTLRDT